jgi:hypothetical protein
LKTLNNAVSDNKTGKPLHHYKSIYQDLDHNEIAKRCNLEFNSVKSCFNLRMLGIEYRIPHPDFELLPSAENKPVTSYEQILLLRYLCEGKYFPSQGKQLAYNEFPWGDLYYRNFEKRCLKRCANAFGKNIPHFIKIIEGQPQLNASRLNIGDASYHLEFINGLYITIILWQGDDEFPPSAQILFDDNFVFAFTAEDLAVGCEILVDRFRGLT